ncbi:MAG: DUF6599 family protein [Armatimonadota bacterium]
MLTLLAASALPLIVGQPSVAEVTEADKARLASYLPGSVEGEHVAGWRRATESAFYVEDNLFEYINGAAEEYIAYGFRLLATAMYESDEADLGKIIVDVYDMGEDINAFGIYSFGRRRDVELLRIGAEAYVMDNHLFCWAGRCFVKVTPAKPKADVRDAVVALAKAVVARIPASKQLPQLLGLLPKKRLIPLTEGYTRVNVLGQEYLRNGVSARYRAGQGELELVVADFGGVPAASDAFAKFRRYESAPPRSAKPLSGIGDEAFEARDPYYEGVLACRHGCYVIIVLRIVDRAEGEDLLRRALKMAKKAG